MSRSSQIDVPHEARADCLIARPAGVLDALTYTELRDRLVKLALDGPRAVVTDIADLAVTSESALTVFLAARNRVTEWPGVPIILAVPDPDRYERLAGSALRRFVPVYRTVDDAIAAVPVQHPGRRIVRAEFAPVGASSAAVRAFVDDTCQNWGIAAESDNACHVATELAENAIFHAGATPFELRLELRCGLLTVAVRDGDPRPAVLRHQPSGEPSGFGLHLVADLAQTWGSAPDLYDGKVVWATLAIGADWLRSLTPWTSPAESG
ncbi:STAS domain-containing protein [Amycolatopsis sp. NPDC051371]|uniref:STAS domain-containing protein n=1 Tax=Amycolatopsis sp. NPDC051371 TaxID=3155800 RepID=UPI00342055B5